jgi:hypothetical protein
VNTAATTATAGYLERLGFVAVSQTAGAAMAVLLVVLLISRELLRVARPGQGDPRALDIAIAPLLIGEVAIVLARFWALV